MLLETFVPKRKARFIPIEYFELIALFIAKHKQRITKGIELHVLFDHYNQAINRFTKVDDIHV